MAIEIKEVKMGQRVFKKNYEQLVREKKKAELAIQSLVSRQKNSFFAGREALLDMARLKIMGGRPTCRAEWEIICIIYEGTHGILSFDKFYRKFVLIAI